MGGVPMNNHEVDILTGITPSQIRAYEPPTINSMVQEYCNSYQGFWGFLRFVRDFLYFTRHCSSFRIYISCRYMRQGIKSILRTRKAMIWDTAKYRILHHQRVSAPSIESFCRLPVSLRISSRKR